MIRLYLLLLVVTLFPALAFPLTHHQLQGSLDPAAGTISLSHLIMTPEPRRSIDFVAHGALTITSEDGFQLTRLRRSGHKIAYRLEAPKAASRFRIKLVGKLRGELVSTGNDYDKGITSSPGHIAPDGVYLGPYSGWYADTGELASFDLSIQLPDGWMAVSQGKGQHEKGWSHWQEKTPQDGIYLVANHFHHYRDGRAEVYLLQPDEALARRYLGATHHYLDQFEQAIGDYPYAKFALVENTWESGFGMPSFTLLGSRVIRLPFILHSSFPHEILHNWWGNGVYVDYRYGNWSEGLTTYLADHAIQDTKGNGASYRRRLLQRFADHAGDGRDFPLIEFTARHSGRTQAVGYGKAAMVFHMLKRRIGEDAFRNGLRELFRTYRFQTASWYDIRDVMAEQSGTDLTRFFDDWLQRRGAASLSVKAIRSGETLKGIRLLQTGAQPSFSLSVPVRTTLTDGSQEMQMVHMDSTGIDLPIPAGQAIERIEIDPDYDTFRSLFPDELPPSVGSLLGADKISIVLPSRTDADRKSAYSALANAWRRDGRVSVITDSDPLPPDGAIWLLDQSNQHLAQINADWQNEAIRIGDDVRQADKESLVLTTRRSTGDTVGWLHLATPEAAAALARKIPHYGRYGYLAFSGPKARNTLRGEWPSNTESLTIRP